MQMRLRLIVVIVTLLTMLPSVLYSRSHFSKPACHIDGYDCIRVHDGDTWYSLFPDDYERGIVMRVNHTNAPLYSGIKLKVPENITNGNLVDYSPLPITIQPEGEKVLMFDPKLHAFGAYDEAGELVRWGPATGGKDWCDDIEGSCRTKPGMFRIYLLGESDCVSKKFPLPLGGAPMPYCMFFDGGQAFHGSPSGVMRGNESHGCVRLFVTDAEWLRYSFVEGPNANNNFRGTKVVVLPYAYEIKEREPAEQDGLTTF